MSAPLSREQLQTMTTKGARFEVHTLADSFRAQGLRKIGLAQAFDALTTAAVVSVDAAVNAAVDPILFAIAGGARDVRQMNGVGKAVDATLQSEFGLTGGGVPTAAPDADMLQSITTSGARQLAAHKRMANEFKVFAGAMADMYALAAPSPSAQAAIADAYAQAAVPQAQALDQQVNRLAAWQATTAALGSA